MYDFAPQRPGGSLLIGNNTITVRPVPLGVNSTDTSHVLYVSGGTGTAEACTIVGGSAIGGQQQGQLIISCAHTHSGAFTIRSATAGLQEAANDGATHTVQTSVKFPAGTFQVYGLASILNNPNICIEGQGEDVTFLNNNSATTGVIAVQSTSGTVSGGCIHNLSITAGTTGSTSITGSSASAIVLNGNGGAFRGFDISNVGVRNHNISIELNGVFYTTVHNVHLLYQNLYGIKLNGTAYIGPAISISNAGASNMPANTAGAGIYWWGGGGNYFSSIDITNMPTAVIVHPEPGWSLLAGFWSDILADSSFLNGFVVNANDGPIFSQEFHNCWASFNGCQSGGALAGNIDNVVTSIPMNTLTYRPSGTATLTIDSENIQCTTYTALTSTYSGCTRGFNGTAAASHTSGTFVMGCNSTADGFLVLGTQLLSQILITGGRYQNNAGNGIHLSAGSGIQITGASIDANSQLQNNLANGILVDSATSHWQVSSNTIGNLPGFVFNKQANGVAISGGSSDYTITGNRFAANVSQAIADQSLASHRVVHSNLGVDDATPGTIASGATVFLPTLAQNTYYVTGTTAITTISGGAIGDPLTLIFTDAAPGGVGTGGNIKRTQAAVQNQRITLVWDGTFWY